MMPSELPPGSRTGEGREMFSQFLQWVTRTIFSQFQGSWGDLKVIFYVSIFLSGISLGAPFQKVAGES